MEPDYATIAGLLPDGLPHSYSDMDNARQINGVTPRTEAEADAVVRAYNRQQNHLRDLPETHQAIVELHEAERARRAEWTE
ncbi:hypothetical protein ACFQV2_23310 [Actinokineospora soli]|uniref:DUF5753 domain-containing protein n=1 Tax=Actinokineospora soli TaxID=1048753 RepID=A0ABW2TR39_9PSEU